MCLERRIGIEVLIEEVQALQNVEAIATCTERMECLVFGIADYSASHGIDTSELGDNGAYLGDVFHHARFRVVMAARAACIDAVDGPSPNIGNEAGYRVQVTRAKAIGMVGKWAIHPAQVAAAMEIFTPGAADVERARKMETAYEAALAKGLGAVQVGGIMVDVAILPVACGPAGVTPAGH